MSDTPIDRNLETKESTRVPKFIPERVEQFEEEYNETIEDIPLDEDQKEVFRLESSSDAYRRIIDLGLAMWASRDLPFGYAFDPALETDLDDAELECPSCGEDDPMLFRLGASRTDGEVQFDTVRCASCEEVHALDEVARDLSDETFL